MDRGHTRQDADRDLAEIPRPLIEAEAFLDRKTGLWRYEFGLPFVIGDTLVWGTHMWLPVDHLARAIATARLRLDTKTRAAYYARLNDAARHAQTLAEMLPGSRIADEIATEFEAAGYGGGNITVDWVIRLADRCILLDVKSRNRDFIEQLHSWDGGRTMPVPDHDPAVLFRSVEKKFNAADPATTLQGVWIGTHLQQSENRLNEAFATLDATKVHFAILGDWESDIHVLARREQDRDALLALFNARPSTRFTFTPPA